MVKKQLGQTEARQGEVNFKKKRKRNLINTFRDEHILQT